MRFSQPLTIEYFIFLLVQEDRDVSKMIESWNIERVEIEDILVRHYREMGLFEVLPLEHAVIIKRDLMLQLQINPELNTKKAKVQQEIERLKARQRK